MSLPDAFLAYKTYGNPKNPVIVFPTWYSGSHLDNEWLIYGENKVLKDYYVICPNMFGNGFSSSPSNQPRPYDGPSFPNVTLADNVRAQYQLITQHLQIKKVFCVLGWSMGAQQTYMWGSMYPDFVERIVPFCGSAKTSIHNFVFLEGPANALRCDPLFNQGRYTLETLPQQGLRAFGRVYAGWGLSQAFYREKIYLKMGYGSIEDFLVGFWEGYFLQKDPNNLLCQLWTWQHGDISATSTYKGDFIKALNGIKAKAMVMPGSMDLYFPPEDNQFEVQQMPNAEFVPIESIWGHWAGGPGTNPVDADFINKKLAVFFKQPI
ncbi:Alpha/Beta hydrolase protein [Globomyces pollinis-pini]|nr:Alpha/Beta hydrolase protein [Globomyces pollinis-pini]